MQAGKPPKSMDFLRSLSKPIQKMMTGNGQLTTSAFITNDFLKNSLFDNIMWLSVFRSFLPEIGKNISYKYV